jgi:hypothetical protein
LIVTAQLGDARSDDLIGTQTVSFGTKLQATRWTTSTWCAAAARHLAVMLQSLRVRPRAIRYTILDGKRKKTGEVKLLMRWSEEETRLEDPNKPPMILKARRLTRSTGTSTDTLN